MTARTSDYGLLFRGNRERASSRCEEHESWDGRWRRRATLLAAAWLGLVTGAPALAQPEVDRLEQRLQAGAEGDLPGADAADPLAPLEEPSTASPSAEASAADDAAAGPDNGAAEPGYLGLICDDQENPGTGLRVLEVVPRGPAAAAGVLPGDVIVALNDQATPGMDEFAAIAKKLPAGSVAELRIERDGQEQLLRAKLVARPPRGERRFSEFGRIEGDHAGALPQPVVPRRRLLGLRTLPLTPEIRRALNVPAEQGALVEQVERGSPADQAGVPPDAVIVSVDGRPVRQPSDLARAVEQAGPGQTIELGYFVGGRLEKRQVVLRDYAAAAAGVPSAPQPERPVPWDLAPPGAMPGPPLDPRLEAVILELQARVAELEQRLEQLESRLPSASR